MNQNPPDPSPDPRYDTVPLQLPLSPEQQQNLHYFQPVRVHPKKRSWLKWLFGRLTQLPSPRPAGPEQLQDSLADTQPLYPQTIQYQSSPYQAPPYQAPPDLAQTNQTPPNQPPYQAAPQYPAPRPPSAKRRNIGCCGCLGYGLLISFLLAAAYFLAPLSTKLLVLGIDRVPEGTALGRSDTMILVSVNPLLPRVAMLSIPRDLWVAIPGVGENRINTAHFFAEANQPGSGPQAAVQVVEENFHVHVPYYVRVRFDAVQSIVDALGGVTIQLSEDTGVLPAGTHHLDGAQALSFVRDRKGADDFFRMAHGQLMLRAMIMQALSPASWSRLPSTAMAALNSIDTNLPFWQWPRLGLALLRATITGIDSRTIQREMVTPYVTDGGAQVLLPDWAQINPLVTEMFK
jgi:polyisoprenyl-teichoic acid--peptidoglycan teichoic acid transferase